MKVTVNVDGKEVEVDKSDIQLPDSYDIVDTKNPPKGLFTQEALNAKIKDRLSKEPEKLKQDEDFIREILAKKGIVLDDNGKPKGLEPTEDPEEIRKQVSKQVSEKYENKLEDLQSQIEQRNKAVVESAIMNAASGTWKEHWTKTYDGSKPLVVKNFADRITVDEQGRDVVLDENGNKMYKGSGEPVRAKDYLTDEEKFGEEFKDNRQRSSGFQNGSSGGTKSFTEEELANMSHEEYKKHRSDIQKAVAENKIK
jgi:hypothetical protein